MKNILKIIGANGNNVKNMKLKLLDINMSFK